MGTTNRWDLRLQVYETTEMMPSRKTVGTKREYPKPGNLAMPLTYFLFFIYK